ncbi:MAG: HDOD domain-containing protein [Planctomycetaceae bacterium]|nr:HDOD domain-containing protein [Planctomycetaceae bacterium]
MHDPRVLDQLVAASRELYSLPTVAVRVLELTSHPAVDSTQLKRCIEQDPALTAKLLRVVNSSLFGMASQVADVGQAITILGIKPLKLLVLGFCLPEGLFQDQAGEVLAWYWRRTLTKAVAAREVCVQVWKLSGDEGFVVGLLADLGLLAFVQGFGEPYVRFLRRVHERGTALEQAERRALGFDHRQFTGRLVDQWNLPHKLRDAILANVIQPDGSLPAVVEETASPLAAVLHQADLLTELLCDSRSGVLGELLECGRVPLTEEQLNALVATLNEKVEQLAEVLRVELSECRDYSEILAESRRQLILIANDAAIELAQRAQNQTTGHEPLQPELELVDEVQSLTAAVARYQPGMKAPRAPVVAAPSFGTGTKLAATHNTAVVHETAPHDVLREQLSLASQVCRQTHVPLSLLIVEQGVADPATSSYSNGALERCESYFELLDTDGKLLLPLGQHKLAVGLIDCDRRLVGELARGMVKFLGNDHAGRKPLTVHLGAATVTRPSPNFDVARLIEAAERCCYASRTAGGNVLKSIEIY